MPNTPKRRFLDLSVEEVSIVDSPANEQMFVVIKNLNEEVNSMPGTKEVEKNAADVVKSDENQEPTKVAVEANPATDEAVAKAMAQVTNLIENISKSFNQETVKDVETKSSDSKSDVSKNEEKPGESEEAETKKNEESASDFADEDSTLAMLSSAIEKAKGFTPKRQAAFKAAVQALNNLAKELGMQEIPVGSFPATSTPSGTMFGASSITKSLEEYTGTITKALGDLAEVTKGLNARIEKVEKMSVPSKSVENEGGTDSNVTKSESIWKGVIQ